MDFTVLACGKLSPVASVKWTQGQNVPVKIKKISLHVKHQHVRASALILPLCAVRLNIELFVLIAEEQLVESHHFNFSQPPKANLKAQSHVFSAQLSVFQNAKGFAAKHQQKRVVKAVTMYIVLIGHVVKNVKFIVVAMRKVQSFQLGRSAENLRP